MALSLPIWKSGYYDTEKQMSRLDNKYRKAGKQAGRNDVVKEASEAGQGEAG